LQPRIFLQLEKGFLRRDKLLLELIFPSRTVKKTTKSKEPKSETEEPAPENKQKQAQKKKMKS
jgi:hypothetical protein